MAGFASPKCGRDQRLLMYPTLEAVLPEDHFARILEEVFETLDWDAWLGKSELVRGRPPIHPRRLAALWTYSLLVIGAVSSRKLEYLVAHCVDFQWLADGDVFDHSTLSDFRMRSEAGLKDLFARLVRTARKAGMTRLGDVALDGTKVRADNARRNALTAEQAEEFAKQAEAEFQKRLEASGRKDREEDDLWGETTAVKLPPGLAKAKDRAATLRRIADECRAADAARAKEGKDVVKRPSRIPLADSDSRILPGKEGNFAPHYVPMAAVDAATGLVVDYDVLADGIESNAVVPTIQRIEERLGEKPQAMVVDAAYPTGPNLAATEEMGVELLGPMPPRTAAVVQREDLSQPVAAEHLEKLPVDSRTKRLDKSAFVYDAALDEYRCPQGRMLQRECRQKTPQGVLQIVYRSPDCSGCPLAERCLSSRNKGGRMIYRDEHEGRRERLAASLADPAVKKRLDARLHVGETVFGYVKNVMGLRRFLLRGRPKVTVEWGWTMTAYNFMKLFRNGRPRYSTL